MVEWWIKNGLIYLRNFSVFNTYFSSIPSFHICAIRNHRSFIVQEMQDKSTPLWSWLPAYRQKKRFWTKIRAGARCADWIRPIRSASITTSACFSSPYSESKRASRLLFATAVRKPARDWVRILRKCKATRPEHAEVAARHSMRILNTARSAANAFEWVNSLIC